jgi:hypothetical protein
LVASTDGGASFNATKPIPGSGTVAMLDVAAGPSGSVAVLFDDESGDTENVWLASSTDRGRTWAATHLAGPFDPGSLPPLGDGLGEYQGVAATSAGWAAAFTVINPRPPLGGDATDILVAEVAR